MDQNDILQARLDQKEVKTAPHHPRWGYER